MAKNSIITELANGQVGLKVSLTRALVIAKRLENEKLSTWIEKELYGYDLEEDIPPYRKVYGNFYYFFNNGYQSGNRVPMPSIALPKELEDLHFRVVRNGIEVIEEFANNHKSMMFSYADLVPYVKLNRLLGVYDIQFEISNESLINIKNLIEKELLNILLELNKKVDNLDDLDPKLDKESKDKVNKTIDIYIDKIFSIGDNNKISKSTIAGGDVDGK